jgi:hypothetical protein
MAYAIRGWRCVLLIIALLFPIAAAAQANKSMFVSVQANQDSAATAKYGAGKADGMAGMLEKLIDDALEKKFPCANVLDRNDVGALLGLAKLRELLGNGDDSALESIGTAVGAAYVVSVSVQETGDSVSINGAVLDSTKSKGISALSRQTTVSSAGAVTYDSLQQYAQNLVNGISGGPKCTGYWKGTVSVTITQNASGNGVSTHGTGKLTCQILGVGQDATCTYESSDVLAGPNGSMTTTKTATDASTWVSVSVTGDKLALTFGAIPLSVNVKGSVPVDPYTESFDGGSYTLHATSDPKHQSGTWTDPNGGPTGNTVVTWKLSLQ